MRSSTDKPRPPGRPPRIPREKVTRARLLAKCGWSNAAIARDLGGVTPQHVGRIVRGAQRAEDPRPEAIEVEVPPELAAVPGAYGEDLRAIYCLLKGAENKRNA